MDMIKQAREALITKLNSLPDAEKLSVLKSAEMKSLYAQIPKLEPSERAAFGAEVNKLKTELEALIASSSSGQKDAETY